MLKVLLVSTSLATVLVTSPLSTGLTDNLKGESRRFRSLVIRPVLKGLGNWSCELETLLLATAAHESHLGRLSKNVFQITEIAASELRRRTSDRFDEPANRWSAFTQVTAAARIYERHGLPNSLGKAASIWKRVYNTTAGKGTVRKFLMDAKRLGVSWRC